MGDGWVNQRQELPFCLSGIVEDLLGDVNEAKHYFIVFSVWALNEASFDLEEFELGDVLIVDIFHGTDIFDDLIKVLSILVIGHLGDIFGH